VNESEYEDLLRIAVRRELTVAEQARLEAWLATRPEARADWLMDQRMNRCLRHLSHVPLSTNFTAQVLQRVERSVRHDAARRRGPAWVRWLGGLGYGWRLAGVAGTLVVVVAIQYHQARQRAELARSLEVLPAVSLAEVDLWRDFETINTLPAGPVPSVDQLAEAFK
jgi:anti-sigma factor RsiW